MEQSASVAPRADYSDPEQGTTIRTLAKGFENERVEYRTATSMIEIEMRNEIMRRHHVNMELIRVYTLRYQ